MAARIPRATMDRRSARSGSCRTSVTRNARCSLRTRCSMAWDSARSGTMPSDAALSTSLPSGLRSRARSQGRASMAHAVAARNTACKDEQRARRSPRAARDARRLVVPGPVRASISRVPLAMAGAGSCARRARVVLPRVNAVPGATRSPGRRTTRAPSTRVHSGLTPGTSCTRRAGAPPSPWAGTRVTWWRETVASVSCRDWPAPRPMVMGPSPTGTLRPASGPACTTRARGGTRGK